MASSKHSTKNDAKLRGLAAHFGWLVPPGIHSKLELYEGECEPRTRTICYGGSPIGSVSLDAEENDAIAGYMVSRWLASGDEKRYEGALYWIEFAKQKNERLAEVRRWAASVRAERREEGEGRQTEDER